MAKVSTRTPVGTDNLVFVLDRTTIGDQDWLRVRLPVRPNGTTGWVPASALSELQPVNTWLKISTKTFKATLIKNGKKVFSARVGVGQSQWPTPKGQFYIRAKLKGYGGKGSFYGPVAFITSATSDVLTDWPGGGLVGVHGTTLAGPDPGQDLARLRAHEERRHPQAGEADAGRDALDGHLIPCVGRKRFAGSTCVLDALQALEVGPVVVAGGVREVGVGVVGVGAAAVGGDQLARWLDASCAPWRCSCRTRIWTLKRASRCGNAVSPRCGRPIAPP